jgi:hypothetical protein
MTESDTGAYWISAFELAERRGTSEEAARKLIRKHKLGVLHSEGRGRPAWHVPAPLYKAWEMGDTGAIVEERACMAILAERLRVP